MHTHCFAADVPRAVGSLLLSCLAGLTGLSCSQPTPQKEPAPQEPAQVAAAGPWADEMLTIADEAQGWMTVSDRARAAPLACVGRPQVHDVSVADDGSTRGRKLYILRASDKDAYFKLFDAPQSAREPTEPFLNPVGLTVVKENFEQVQFADEHKARESNQPWAMDGDRMVGIGAAADLFIMTKLDPSTPGTDQGWVYGVVSPDRKTVINAGMIESCMKCHTQTTRDRLYGPPSSWAKDVGGKPTLPIVAAVSGTPPEL